MGPDGEFGEDAQAPEVGLSLLWCVARNHLGLELSPAICFGLHPSAAPLPAIVFFHNCASAAAACRAAGLPLQVLELAGGAGG